MSKKKTTTAETRPSIIPITKSKGDKKSKGKTADEKATPAAPAAHSPDGKLAETPPFDGATTTDRGATSAAETPTAPTDIAGQTETPSMESPPAEDATATKKSKVKAKKEQKPKKMSCLDAAAKVLVDTGTSMTTAEMIEAMGKAKLWSSPNGQTPAATLYSALLREINTKGAASRFIKTERGKFAAKA